MVDFFVLPYYISLPGAMGSSFVRRQAVFELRDGERDTRGRVLIFVSMDRMSVSLRLEVGRWAWIEMQRTRDRR
jgi:hypothetical protein